MYPSSGSSPRIRGEYRSARRQTRHLRIIPANTGRITTGQVSSFAEGDHPREYGENSLPLLVVVLAMGSSPRIRGECHTCVSSVAGTGIIPANTGRMTCQFRVWIFTRDHPREYGENTPQNIRSIAQPGSSPRIRGEYTGYALSVYMSGIIPANTGRILLHQETLRVYWDHPREYGENCRAENRPRQPGGSSPRIRGESIDGEGDPAQTGIIPANTGRIVVCSCESSAVVDHPREYGENSTA